MATKKNKTERVFIWRFRTKKEAEMFQTFFLKSIVGGNSVQENLQRMISNFNDNSTLDFTPATEGDMLAALHKKKFKTTRQSLKNMRDRGDLEGLWFTDGKSIVYNKEAVLEFMKQKTSKN